MEPIDLNNVQQNEKSSNGMATASLVLGVLSLIPIFYFVMSPIFALLAIIFGIIGKKKGTGDDKKRAVAGLICGIIGLVISIVATILIFSFISLVFKTLGAMCVTLIKIFNIPEYVDLIKEGGVSSFLQIFQSGDGGSFVESIKNVDLSNILQDISSGEVSGFLDAVQNINQ